jgi:hypothetical protein
MSGDPRMRPRVMDEPPHGAFPNGDGGIETGVGIGLSPAAAEDVVPAPGGRPRIASLGPAE